MSDTFLVSIFKENYCKLKSQDHRQKNLYIVVCYPLIAICYFKRELRIELILSFIIYSSKK